MLIICRELLLILQKSKGKFLRYVRYGARVMTSEVNLKVTCFINLLVS